LTVNQDDPYALLIGGAANSQNGALYEVEITRDEDCHITGWAGSPIEVFAEAAYNDGGVTYGPEGVLFLARWPPIPDTRREFVTGSTGAEGAFLDPLSGGWV